MRDIKMVEGCLGEGEAKLWKVLGSNGRVLRRFASATEAAEHGSGTGVDCKMKLGYTKHMEF